jgi:sugar/nucleoside kinase (ribokinase family)
MKKIIITLGGATEDINIYPKEAIVIDNKDDLLKQKLLAFEYGAKISINDSINTFGGGAANAAVNFSNLGFNSLILTILGKDERAERILNNFKKKKVNTDLIIYSKKKASPFSLIIIGPKKEHVAFVSSACKEDMKIGEPAKERIKKADWLYVSSLTGEWEKNLKEVIDLPKNVAWNPGLKQLKMGAR